MKLLRSWPKLCPANAIIKTKLLYEIKRENAWVKILGILEWILAGVLAKIATPLKIVWVNSCRLILITFSFTLRNQIYGLLMVIVHFETVPYFVIFCRDFSKSMARILQGEIGVLKVFFPCMSLHKIPLPRNCHGYFLSKANLY